MSPPPPTPPTPSKASRARRVILGDRPRSLLWLLVPTASALVVDLVLRARAILDFAVQGKAIYFSSLLVSMGFWVLPLWTVARLSVLAGVGGAAGVRARVLSWVLRTLFLLPIATLAYGGQLVYFRVFHTYAGRDSIRLGIAARGTVVDWFSSFGGPLFFVGMVVSGTLFLFFTLRPVERRAVSITSARPYLPVALFLGALFCFWTDNVDSRFLQAATPDACIIHGLVHAARMRVTGHWDERQGVSMRTPRPLGVVKSDRPRPRDVVIVLTESVRADESCSMPPPSCKIPALDDLTRDRVSLGKLSTQTPNTFSSFLTLTTGLSPDATFEEAHAAPILWEMAKAAGYHTAYVSAQNTRFEDFGAFVRNAGIDTLVTDMDLGGMGQEQIGAPDERAVAAAIAFLSSVTDEAPLFLVVHLSNTHAPYRADPGLTPFLPESTDALGDASAFLNRSRNAVALQARTLAPFFSALRGRPRWNDTIAFFLSDHGEQFREHGGLYHNHSLYDEELRIPGFVVGGGAALDTAMRNGLATFTTQRTYMMDVHQTVVAALGLSTARASMPLASRAHGRSLFAPRVPEQDPFALLSTSTAVWEPDDPRFGVVYRDRKLWGPPGAPWKCFDLSRDSGEHFPRTGSDCDELLNVARFGFPTQAPR